LWVYLAELSCILSPSRRSARLLLFRKTVPSRADGWDNAAYNRKTAPKTPPVSRCAAAFLTEKEHTPP
jgi:hypothetical protein